MSLLIAALLVVAAPLALAQSPAHGVNPDRVAEALATTVEQHYVVPDTGRLVAAHLRRRAAAGAYRGITEPAQLADRLTADMQSVNGDRHLYVTFGQRAGAVGAQMVMRRPGGSPAPEDVWARRANYDIHSAQRLAGNVGYLAIQRLSSRGSADAFAVIDAAMAFLQRTDAMIIDLRGTIGGEPRMADYVASWFFGAEPVPTLTSYHRASDQTLERTTVPVNGVRRPDVPLYVLVGPGTASGGEDLAFIFRQSGRGTLVGARTAGAGRLTRLFPLGGGFTASVSGGRTYDPRTGLEWERVGIEPHLPAPVDEALTAAHAAALERVAETTTDSTWKATLLWTRRAMLARARPAHVPEARLRAYAGDYDLRLVRFEGGRLWYQRDTTRPREELIPVDDRTFALGEAFRVEFVLAGTTVSALTLTDPMGQTSTFPRTR